MGNGERDQYTSSLPSWPSIIFESLNKTKLGLKILLGLGALHCVVKCQMKNEMNLKFIPNAIFRLPVIAESAPLQADIFISYCGFVISGAWGRERETKMAEWLGSARLRSR